MSLYSSVGRGTFTFRTFFFAHKIFDVRFMHIEPQCFRLVCCLLFSMTGRHVEKGLHIIENLFKYADPQ